MSDELAGTLVFLLDRSKGRILLARKQRKVGAGRWNGYGGKREPEDRTMRDCAVRELEKESGGIKAKPEDLELAAVITFTFKEAKGDIHPKQWRVWTYLLDKWTGHPRSTSEMKDPTWFDVKRMPLHDMMPADRDFLRYILRGDRGYCFVEFTGDEKRVEQFRWIDDELAGEQH